MQQNSTYVIMAIRWKGLEVVQPLARVLIQEEVIKNQREWVVDLNRGHDHEGVLCDSCDLVSSPLEVS
jgi:hypothetical protein